MCGIAGIFLFNEKNKSRLHRIEKMTEVLHHRGPDDNGYFVNSKVAFGHKRLSVIDLSSNARQPMTNEDGSLVLVFNGEIYNFKELRKSLIAKGHSFKSNSDGEVILHLYEEYDVECSSYLEGMFAFAIYDLHKNTLYLARDRIGEKPLYYFKDNDGFYFSSEIKSFPALDNFDKKISPAGLYAYFNYVQIPAPQTIFDGVKKIRPAHWLHIKPNGHETTSRFWSVDCTKKTKISIEDAKEELKYLLLDSIKKMLVSDVPVGITLSGGVDSTLILAMSQDIGTNNITSITVGDSSRGTKDEEYIRARKMAMKFNVENHVYNYNNSDFSELIKAVKLFDEPVGHLAIFFITNIYEKIKKHAKVVLTGSGADEIFGGYSTYCNVKRLSNWTRMIRPIIKKNNHTFSSCAAAFGNIRKWTILKKYFSEDLKVCKSQDDSELLLMDTMRLVTYDNILDAKLFMDLLVLLNHTVSAIPDISSMAHSVEARSPFLHHKVIEFAATLPIDYKVKDQNNPFSNKLILKNLACDYFDKEDVFAPKYGFGRFIDFYSLLKNQWKNDIESLIFDPMVQETGFFNTESIKIIWERFQRDHLGLDERMMFSKFIVFCAWYKFNFKSSN